MIQTQPLSCPQQNMQGGISHLTGWLTEEAWIQVSMLSSEIGFQWGPTPLAGLPLHRDPNMTTALPGTSAAKDADKWVDQEVLSMDQDDSLDDL